MKKLSPVLTIILFGCGLAQSPISDNTKPNIPIEKPLAKYQECMGYSDKTIRTERLNDGRFVDITNYCYTDRKDITKSYCGHFVYTANWHSECKNKLMAPADNK